MKDRILVTGANGFVGQHLCRALSDSGRRVTASVRSTESLAQLPLGVAGVVVSTSDSPGDWLRALDGADAVIHLIGLAHDTAPAIKGSALDRYRQVNVRVMKAIVAASRVVGVRRFVYLSSIKAVGEGRDEPYSEESPCRPEDPYGRSKREAEEVLLKPDVGSALEAVVVRPPLVYGPHVKGNFGRLLHALYKRRPLPFARLHARRSMVFVENLCQCLVTVVDHPDAANEVFHVADDEVLSVRDLATRVGMYLDRPARLFPVRPDLLVGLARILKREPQVRRLVRPLLVSGAKLEHRLGWSPPLDADAGLRVTANWFRDFSHESR